jgi:hypothetical protein
MSLVAIRWTLLALAAVALLSATILYWPLYNATVRPWLRLAERAHGGPVALPAVVRLLFTNERVQRAWHLLWAALFVAGWWYLGTPAGERAWAALAAQAGGR